MSLEYNHDAGIQSKSLLSAKSIRCPAGAEIYGLQPVPKPLRQGGIWPLFNIFSNLFINPGTLITSGMMIMAGLSFQTTVLLQVFSVMLGMIPFLLFARAGVRYGIPGQVLCRAVFGVRGSQWLTSMLRLLCSIYWFAFQTAAGALAIEAILRNCFQLFLPLWVISLNFALFQGVVAIVGYSWLKGVSLVSFPLKVLCFSALLVFLYRYGGDEASVSVVLAWPGYHWHWPLIATWLNTIVSTCFTCVTDASDFSRYTRSEKSLWIGTLSGSLVGIVIGALFGAYAVVAGGAVSINPFETITQLQPGGLVILLIMLVIFLDNWTINVINLYTGGLSLCNSVEWLGRFWATVIVVLAASVLACFPFLINKYSDVMGCIGAFFAPITGVMLVWYYYEFSKLDLAALYQKNGAYWYRKGFNVFACLLAPAGLLFSFFLPVTVLPALLIMFLASLIYWLYARREFQGHSEERYLNQN
ncbi:purine-cytosine permease family protein [Kistimonas asteriae]|uniref:purine-cytosine permease family protein n=1 Tax=Kistimonas asteriae TaxID=517724 RepID=UPI001BA4C607|nr:cytosine permease [Kistimonas asteriae]